MSDASAAAVPNDPYRLGHDTARARTGHGHGHGSAKGHAQHAERDAVSKRIIVGYGFWIFLLSDIVMFSSFFAAFAVLLKATAGGADGAQLFDPVNAAWETGFLLLSSFTCGLAGLGVRARNQLWFQAAMAVTFLFGACFLFLEIREFYGLVVEGEGPTRSAFLSAFFALVGCHGLHVTLGMLWLLTMMAQVFTKGFRMDIEHRILCFSLFWHALDIIWVGVFTVVYLIGAGA